ncbi:hypothetical protein CMO88_03310 [Candidatus Woesearchaeota archaeon]|nr:hypothetical protein [Candidatus Woesearchaeota archaeon]|tara:strand:+ start:632 stop:1114 length:483 start_codon:yes stop_codon:yes gene_type:complete
MITAVDTNILLDILGNDLTYLGQSSALLEKYSNMGSLMISPIVYSEILTAFLRKYRKNEAISELHLFLRDLDVQIYDFAMEDFNLSAERWHKFSKFKQIQCPKCGAVNKFNCNKCKSQVTWRNHILTDFLIGAHAQNNAELLLTRNKGYFKKYFNIKILP